MISLYDYLLQVKNYTWAEAEETCIRFDNGFKIPEKIQKDIKEYFETYIYRK